jgi:leucine dehydrogenase
MFASFAEALNRLKGIYICAEDVGCTLEDIGEVARTTPFAVGLPHEKSSGNPSPFTAWGVFRGIQAACKKRFGSDSVQGRTIAIQGVGSVGERLAELLFWHGAKLILTDLNTEKAEHLANRYGGIAVPAAAIYEQECDVFAPCAMGGILNPQTLPKLRCKVVAGAANNQLLSDQDGEWLMRHNILYAPDFVINAGGLINVTEETMESGYDPLRARDKTGKIYDQLMMIFEISDKNRISTNHAAERLADYRLQYQIGRRLEPIYLHHANYSY